MIDSSKAKSAGRARTITLCVRYSATTATFGATTCGWP